MAIPKIKATYSLDVETVRVLERAAARWGVSKSAALVRAIRASDAIPDHADNPAKLLDELQKAAALSARSADAWEKEFRSERGAVRTSVRRKR